MVPASRSSNEHEEKKTKSGAEDSEDESEILEESPCGRWLKRREEVQQRDVPGIDAAYLAMDTEEGVEVVWNEVRFSERKNFKAQEEKIRQVFDNLTQLEHPNIVKFHKYWIDSRDEKPRVIFITEYMSSGSLKQFLKRTKRNVKKPPLQSWKRWCTQILSALSYLHSCSPPIVHGNLTCDTIFIQHNGLIKIGSVAPDAIHQHVKTCRDNVKNTHFIAPEFGTILTPAVDIYSFGMCALEMGALEIHGNGDSGTVVTEEHVQRTIATLEVPVQKDLVGVCLKTNPEERPSAKELLFHKAIFELPSLRLLAAHIVVRIACKTIVFLLFLVSDMLKYTKVSYPLCFIANISETISDEAVQRHYGPGVLVAEVIRKDGTSHKYHSSDIPVSEKLEKFMEDVKFGIYPLPTLSPPALVCPGPRPRAISPETAESVASDPPEPVDTEARRVTNMICDVKPRDEGSGLVMTLLLRMDDKMNRQLSCIISESDSAIALAEELVHYGFINAVDKEKIAQLINNSLSNCLDRNENGDCREKIEAISHMPLPVSIAS